MRERDARFVLLRKLHSECIAEMHRIGPALFEPAIAPRGDQRYSPSAQRSADTTSLSKGPANHHLRNEILCKELVGPAEPCNQTAEKCALVTSSALDSPSAHEWA